MLDHSVDWQRLNEFYQMNELDCTRSSCNILICGTVMSEWNRMKMEFTVWIWFVCIEWESTNLNKMGLWTVEYSMSWDWKRIAQYFWNCHQQNDRWNCLQTIEQDCVMEIIIKLKIKSSNQLHCYRFLTLVLPWPFRLVHSNSIFKSLQSPNNTLLLYWEW